MDEAMIHKGHGPTRQQPAAFLLCLLVLLIMPGIPSPEAFIFTAIKGAAKAGKLAKAGKAGGAAAGATILLDAGNFLRKVAPEGDDVWRVAAKFDEGGNLHLTNASGGEWVVRSLDDMASLPDPGAKLARREIYVADEVLWRNLERFNRLPDNTALYVVRDGKTPYRMHRNGATWHAELNTQMDVVVAPGKGADFREAIFRMRRNLNASPAPTGSASLQGLSDSWAKLKGQTLIANSRISDDLRVESATLTGAQRINLADLADLAEDADINLVALDLPGFRPDVTALETAVRKASNLETLLLDANPGRKLRFEVLQHGDTHVVMRGRASQQQTANTAAADEISRGASNMPGVIQDAAGAVVDAADALKMLEEENQVIIIARSEATQTEYDERVFPWLPTSIMWFMVVNWICGIFTMATLWRWWTTLWPLVPFKQNPRKWLWVFAAPLRVIGCVALFLPLAGGTALAFNVITFLWVLCVLLPYRLVQRLIYKVRMFTMRRRLRRQSLAN